MITKIIEKINWKFLSNIHNNSFVKNTLWWVVFVPIIAKIFSSFEEAFSFSINGKEYLINLELPFSWSLLYFSAFFFLLGNIVYKIFVPTIIDENKSFSDFLDKGKGKYELKKYVKEENLNTEDYYELYDDNVLMDDLKYDFFSDIWNKTILINKIVRVSIGLIYFVAISIISYVFYQNLKFVIFQSIKVF